MKAMILAAGFGTRLLPLTAGKSKVALPLAGVPVLVRVLQTLRRLGVSDFIVNLHHAPDSVRRCLESAGETARYSFEPQILGTGGALFPVKEQFAGGTFLLVNGDCYYENPDLESALEFHRSRGALATLVLIDMPPGQKFRTVDLDQTGRIVRIAGRPEYPRTPVAAALHFPGIHILEPEFLEHIGPGFSDINSSVYPGLIASGAPLYGYRTAFRWHDLGTPGRFFQAAGTLLEQSGRESGGSKLVGEGCRLSESCVLEGPLEIGEDSRLGPDCRVARSILGREVVLEAGALVEDSLVGDKVRLAAGSAYRHCVIAGEAGNISVVRWED
ncbi:MAG: hypothetical protein A2Z86_04130 [Candidatus Glassbacteria bacterium GWA2_58_10]|uniref:Nucleotidyl transferase domain-containing protein n=1 Tax=Candidatus Glassbacteria bacterium GWA2_58_10 TaxID=1817865 RepID=A0A1F5YG76_9BACT|nr:MAG: hypothetical protein A2Z86_04130 [Candidatus Glassbacteria bacterium GWA2_58_10]